MRGWSTVWVLLALAIAGCGSTDSTDAPARDTQATKRSPEQKLRSKAAEIAAEARIVCSLPSRKEFARDFHMSSTDPAALAHRYARGYHAAVRAQVEAACLRGLRAR